MIEIVCYTISLDLEVLLLMHVISLKSHWRADLKVLNPSLHWVTVWPDSGVQASKMEFSHTASICKWDKSQGSLTV